MITDESRFKLSHEFKSILLKHLIEWAEGIEHLDFKLRNVKILMWSRIIFRTLLSTI